MNQGAVVEKIVSLCLFLGCCLFALAHSYSCVLFLRMPPSEVYADDGGLILGWFSITSAMAFLKGAAAAHSTDQLWYNVRTEEQQHWKTMWEAEISISEQKKVCISKSTRSYSLTSNISTYTFVGMQIRWMWIKIYFESIQSLWYK